MARLFSGMLFVVLALSGCSSGDLPDYVKLDSLRVLALKVKAPGQPEMNPGGSVTLQPLVSDINGAGRALTYAVAACRDPGIGYGVPAACTTPDFTIAATAVGALTTVFATQTNTGIAPEFTVPLPDASIFNGVSSDAQYNGVPYLIFYTISAADGTSVQSFRRILISPTTKTTKNANPTITSVTSNGTALDATNPVTLPTSGVDLSVTYPDASVETYQVMAADGSLQSQTEFLTATWFYSDGSLDKFRTFGTDTNHWNPPSAAPTGRGAIFAVVLRDARGGEDFQLIEFR